VISIIAHVDYVQATYISQDGTEVQSKGASLTEAVEGLVVRFKELQDAALHELRDRGFIRVERAAQGAVS